MTQAEFEIFLSTLLISLILGLVMTGHWRALHNHSIPARTWMIASWVIFAANAFFLTQTVLPTALGRVSATFLVTFSFLAVWMGASRSAGQTPPWRSALAIAAVNLGVLILFQLNGNPYPWRMVSNGIFWSSIFFAAFVSFRRAPMHYWRAGFSPANVCLAHGIFHVLRVGLAILFSTNNWGPAGNWLHTISDISASCFNVALFLSLLIADIRLRHDELSSARTEIEVLSGLLPVCSWCKKIRDDKGYWQQVDEYLSKKSNIKITHGMCTDCFQKVMSE